jgi:hypothetical protein
MPSITLRAHFNGTQVILDEPVSLEPNTKLLVTVLSNGTDSEADEWYEFSAQQFASAFGENEPEYGSDDLVEVNPYVSIVQDDRIFPHHI